MSEHWWMNPRSVRMRRKSEDGAVMVFPDGADSRTLASGGGAV